MFVTEGPMGKMSVLLQEMALHQHDQTDDKPLSEAMMT